MPARLSLPARPLLYAGLLYLALPMILFLWGWLQPFFSLPLCATLAYGLHATVRKLPEWRFSLTKRGTVLLLLLSAGCLLLTFLCGFTGHFQQHADFTIRNAVYGQLIAERMASRHAGRPPFHLLSGSLAAACLRSGLLPCCIRFLAAGRVDLPRAGTGAPDSGLPLGNPENRLVDPATPLSRFACRVSGLPGHASLAPVSGI